MFARRNDLWCKRMAVWQLVLCLTLLSFLGRSAIPPGYMPDRSGSAGSVFAITLCSMGGTSTMQVDLAGESGDHGPGDSYPGLDCPFGLTLAQTPMPGGTALALKGSIFILHAVAAIGRLPHILSWSQGPPLGPRAPPVRLV